MSLKRLVLALACVLGVLPQSKGTVPKEGDATKGSEVVAVGVTRVDSVPSVSAPADGNPRQTFTAGARSPDAATATHVAAAKKEKLQIYLLLGQSNMYGRGRIESQDRSPHPRVFFFTVSNHWDLAVEPLHGGGPRAGIGPGLAFAKTIAAWKTNVSIGLVPCAVGATALSQWERRGDLYSNAVVRARLAMRDGMLTGILWHQGEQDSMTITNAQTYHDRLARMIRDLRLDLGQPHLPFVVGQIGEFLYSRKKQQTPFAQTVNDALIRIPQSVPFTACVRSTGLTHGGDEVHFDNQSQRELGKRYAAEMWRLEQAQSR